MSSKGRRVRRYKKSKLTKYIDAAKSTKIKLERKPSFLIAYLMLTIIVVGLLHAIKFGHANLEYYIVRNFLDSWQQTGVIKSKQDFDKAVQASETARYLHPSNPLYIELAGQLDEWSVLAGYSGKTGLQGAKSHYLLASQVRPLWPVTWANLAMIKWRLQEFDEEMLSYVLKADELGSQSVEVHILFARLGLSLYKANHPMYTEIKDIVHARIRSGIRNQQSKPHIIEYIQTTESTTSVCRWLQMLDPGFSNKDLKCV